MTRKQMNAERYAALKVRADEHIKNAATERAWKDGKATWQMVMMDFFKIMFHMAMGLVLFSVILTVIGINI